jgi:hypothetical protein
MHLLIKDSPFIQAAPADEDLLNLKSASHLRAKWVGNLVRCTLVNGYPDPNHWIILKRAE